MAKKKAAKLVIDDDEDDDWDDLIEDEEEIDDIIDDDEEDLDDDDDDDDRPSSGRGKRSLKKGKKVSHGNKSGRRKGSHGGRKLTSHPVVKWTGRVLITIIVVFLLFAPVQPFVEMREATGIDSLKNLMRPYRNFPEWVNVTMELTFDVSIRNGQAESIDIQIAAPFDIPLETDSRQTVIQDVKSIEMTPDPTGGLPDFNTEHNFLTGWYRENQNPGPYQYKALYNLHLHTFEWDMDEEDSGTVEDIPEKYDVFLGDDWPVLSNGKIVDANNDDLPDHYRYNPGDPRIDAIAHQLTDGEPTVLGKVKAIYDWMLDNFNYTSSEQRQRDNQIYGDMPKWATGCLADWYGDCDDQSLLMASLCRAVNIPAWLEIGYLYDQVTDEWGGHGWFNVIIPQTDPGLDPIIAPIDPVNSEFLFRDPFRITDWIDNGSYIVEDDGDVLYNLDDYYNFFSTRNTGFVDVEVDTSFRSVQYEEHGNIKKYVDQRIEPGNIQGTEQGIPDLPLINPLLVIPSVLLLIAIPARKILIKRS